MTKIMMRRPTKRITRVGKMAFTSCTSKIKLVTSLNVANFPILLILLMDTYFTKSVRYLEILSV